MWSAKPLSDAVLTSDAVWEDVFQTNVTLSLETQSEVLASYALTAVATRRPYNVIGASDFYSSSTGASQRNFLQIRLIIDGVPFRQSSSHASPGLTLETNIEVLSGYAAVRLDPGLHEFRLQWKKIGPGVSSWASRPSIGDGFMSGRSLAITSRHSSMWYSSAESTAVINSDGVWLNLQDSSLAINLTRAGPVRFLYTMTVRSDQAEVEQGIGHPQ